METASVYRERFTSRPLLPDGSSSIAVRLRSGCWMLGSIALALPAPAQDGGHLRRRCDSLFVRKVDCNGYPNAPLRAARATVAASSGVSATCALRLYSVCQGAGGERNGSKIQEHTLASCSVEPARSRTACSAPTGVDIANDNSILRLKRVNDTSWIPDPTAPLVAQLPYTVKGVGVQRDDALHHGCRAADRQKNITDRRCLQLTGSPTNDPDGVNAGGPLAFSGTPSQLFGTSAPASGIVFDAVGNLIIASDSSLDSAPPLPPPPPLPPIPYSSHSALIGSGIAAVGVAINTCREVVRIQRRHRDKHHPAHRVTASAR